MKTCTGSVKFSNVTFSYEPGRPVIKDFNLEIRPGQSVAIVGESGSGKSTLLRLLLRFYDVDQGSIQIDGVDIRDMTMKSLRRLFGVVPQEATLYNDSIMYNLLYAKADADPEAVYQACKNASIHQKIESLPRQYDTLIGERGLKLSGGERQRVGVHSQASARYA
jgi:ATP-binding cassette, subfamily B, vacuolar membrane transporter HMT1/ACLQ